VTGFVLCRVRAHRLLLAAALLTVVLTTSVLATLAAFSSAVGDAGLRRALQGQSAARTLLEVKVDVTGRDRSRLDAAVRRTAASAYDGLPVRVAASTQSGPYGLPLRLRPPGEVAGGQPDLTLLATFDPSRVTMVAGARPGRVPAHGPVPVALPEIAARALRLHPGDRVTLADRLGGRPLPVRLTGVYRPVDRGALYWRLDPLAGRGVNTLAFTTYGPMLADPSAFAGHRVAAATMSWQARADFSTVTAGRIPALRSSIRRAQARIGGGSARVSTDLPALLTDVDRSLLVARSTLLIGALQLVVLAGFALLLVARLLAGERSGEAALLRARGGSRGRIAALAAVEALLLAVPAGAAALLLAGPLVRLLAGHGALGRARLRFAGTLDGSAWWVAAVSALACALVIALPALRRSGTYAQERAARTRRGALPGAVRAGADLGLLAVAGLAYWQLSRRATGSGVLTAGRGGTLGADPVLVAAPALCLLAGTVLAIRLLPLVARLGERRAALGRGLTLPLAGWQLARRPGRGAGPVLLLVLTVAMGIFAIGQGASWDRSQRDQADYAVGADVRVTGTQTPQFGQAGMFASVPGVTAVTPAARTQEVLDQNRLATVLALDTVRAPGILRFRPDQAGVSPRRLLAPLDTARPAPAGLVLPAGTVRLRLTARLTASGPGGRPVHSGLSDAVTATVVDRYGVPYQIFVANVPADGRPHEVTLDLAAAAGATGSPVGPLRVARLTADYYLPVTPETHLLTLAHPRAVARDGTTRPVRVPQAAWHSTVAIADPDFHPSPADGYHSARSHRPTVTGSALGVRYTTGGEPFDPYDPDSAELTLSTAAGPAPKLAAVATDSFLRAAGTKVGGTAQVQLSGVGVTVRITHAVRSLPTATADSAASDGGAVLLDLRAVNQVLAARSAPGFQPSEWWLATRPGAQERVAAALRAGAADTTVLARGEQERELSADPLEAGPRSALPAAAVAAAVLAAAGFAVATAGSLRERTEEFAVLRALGAPRGRIARMIAAEQGLLVLIAVAVGVALGTLLTRLVVPLVVLTTRAARPVPEVVVELPADRVLELLAAVLAVPLLVVVAVAVRRGDPVPALRRGGE
jgi:FtsX-like permease family